MIDRILITDGESVSFTVFVTITYTAARILYMERSVNNKKLVFLTGTITGFYLTPCYIE